MPGSFEYLPEVTRLEIIDHRGGPRLHAHDGSWHFGRNIIVSPASPQSSIALAFQDGGRTLKIFIADRAGEAADEDQALYLR